MATQTTTILSGEMAAAARSPTTDQRTATASIGNVNGSSVGAPAATPVDSGSGKRDTKHNDGASLDAAVKTLNQSPQMTERSLEFSIDKTSDKVVVKIVDRKTGEVIRQIPSKETLALAQELKKGAAHLFSAKA